jgi:hypothetical protein
LPWRRRGSQRSRCAERLRNSNPNIVILRKEKGASPARPEFLVSAGAASSDTAWRLCPASELASRAPLATKTVTHHLVLGVVDLRPISESISPVAQRCVVIAKQPAVKRYIVTLSVDERERLNMLIQKGTSPARQVLKARILLKADASEAGEAWSHDLDRRSAGHQHRHHRPHAPAVGGGRPRCSPDPQALSHLRQKAHLRPCRRGQADRARLLSVAERTQAVDGCCWKPRSCS